MPDLGTGPTPASTHNDSARTALATGRALDVGAKTIACKSLMDMKLQREIPIPSGRGGFTLVELLVSVAVLVLMLAITGRVMKLTADSTGKASAITEINQQLRVLENMIREDLAHIDPERSVMIIQGNPINAYWTRLGKEADSNADPADGYPHDPDPEREITVSGAGGNVMQVLDNPRADVVMFFTTRDGRSGRYPVSGRLQQVVYGHAQLGEYAPGASAPLNDPDDFQLDPEMFPPVAEVAPIPASEWLLARRSVLLTPVWLNITDPPASARPDHLGHESLLRGETDLLENFNFDLQVLEPLFANTTFGSFPYFYPPFLTDAYEGDISPLPFARSRLDPTPPPTIPEPVNSFLLERCASFKVEWALDPYSEFVGGRLTGENEVYWFDPAEPVGNDYTTGPLRTLQTAWNKAEEQSLPNEEDLWQLLTSPLGGKNQETPYSLIQRFQGPDIGGPEGDPSWVEEIPEEAAPNRIATFTATRGSTNDEGEDVTVPEDVFPGALRITIDVYDRNLRLDRPVRHVIIAPIGS